MGFLMLIGFQVLLELFLGGAVLVLGRELASFKVGEFIGAGRTMGYLYEQKLWLELSHWFSTAYKAWESLIWS